MSEETNQSDSNKTAVPSNPLLGGRNRKEKQDEPARL